MAGSLKGKTKKALGIARAAAQTALENVSLAAHNTLVDTEKDVLKVSDEVETHVSRAVTNARIATKKAGAKLKKK